MVVVAIPVVVVVVGLMEALTQMHPVVVVVPTTRMVLISLILQVQEKGTVRS